ncbi:MAG: XRE family transcriptional regulator [Nitrospiraceae bacterium]|nr:MAG: XRE family transcriptional regulator [Nitrospiraceae bacterium]
MQKKSNTSKKVGKLIGAQIARIRKEREITQAQLAETIDVTVETISRLERGVSIPSLKTIETISHALNVTMKELFDFEYSVRPADSDTDRELRKLLAFLKTRNSADIRLGFHILKSIFQNIEHNYQPRG